MRSAADRMSEFGYWPIEELPPRVVAATLAIEDRRFWMHPGVDPIGVVRALGQNIKHGERISGASTLAMQVARLQHPGPRTYSRKLVESLTALALTLRYGREAVLASLPAHRSLREPHSRDRLRGTPLSR